MQALLKRCGKVKFGCVVADPPWQFGDKLTMAPTKRGAESNYPTMGLDALLDMGKMVQAVIKPDAHLYLWCPSSLLDEGIDVMDEWDFTLKTTLIWDKRTVTGKQHFGMGRYYRAAHEVVLFGTRGKAPALNKSQRTVFTGPVGRHSQKPEVLQDMAEKVSPGPFLELFGRRKRTGWTVLGNEV
jgi:N6-adenosine-specific RNA methylase IME4